MPSVRQLTSRTIKTSDSRSSKNPLFHGKKSLVESRLIFVLGGARSGKSSFALQQGKGKSPRAFVATGEPFDQEMATRIRKHQRSRGKGWITKEVPIDLADWLVEEGAYYPIVVVDCLTLWLNNLLRNNVRASRILFHVRKLLQAIRSCPTRVVLVSNELGMGLVPGDSVSREFRDLSGRMNQVLAAEADEVHFLVSGIPLRVK